MRVHLEAASDHVQKLAKEHDPLGAIKELVWNALDADATRVDVEFGLGGLNEDGLAVVEKITVRDNGTGIAPEATTHTFDRIGGSWKKFTPRTPTLGRRMHGSLGHGRLRGFALGLNVRWTTVADGIDGRTRTQISSNAGSRKDFDISDPVATTAETGTVFEAWGRQSSILDALLSESSIGRFTAEFATYLTVYSDIKITYNNVPIDPEASIHRDERYPLSFTARDGSEKRAVLRVVEWTMSTPRELHLCDADGMTIDIVSVGIQAPAFNFTAYVHWDEMPEHQGELLLSEDDDSDVGRLLTTARAALKEHFKNRASEQRREVIEKWKVDGSYPYDGDPKSESEQLERDTFDVVATTVHRHMPKPVKHQKVTLALIREAVKHQPENVHHILDEVFRLSSDDKNQLDRLLNRTSLSSMIKASASVADRLDFLAALSHMVFDTEARKMMKERSQLHKILENEAWIFGDHYSLLVSDQSLDTVLDRHLKKLGRLERNPRTPVRREDGSTGIVDLMLSRARREYDRRQHLIVELKAPKVIVGSEEIQQIKSYAQAVAFDDQFRDVRTEWDFWLVTTDMSAVAKMEARPTDRKPGCILHYAQDGMVIRVWLKCWSEIIEECRDRLQYFREHLEHDPSLEQALDYLRINHSPFVPTRLIPAPRPSSTDSESDSPQDSVSP